MKNQLFRLWMFAVITGLLAAGCAASPTSTPTSISPAASTNTTSPTTAAPATQAATTAATSVAVQPTITEPTVVATEAVTAASPSATADVATPATAQATTSGTGSLPATEALKFVIVPDQSQADYRVREQLANLNSPSDAIGKTSAVSGTLAISPDGTIDSSSSKFTVDLSTLQSDRPMRDNFVRRNTLKTDQFPQATFVPKQVTGLLNPLPQSGNLAFQLTGDLTIQDVTKPVTWDVTGQIQNGQIKAHATTNLTFEDFNLQQPRVSVVLSVEDKILLELDLLLQQAQ